MSERNTSEFDKLSREIEQLIYVPGKGAGVRGYGLTLTERFPSYSTQEVSALKKRNVRHSMVILAGIVVGVICGLAATALNWGIALISGVFIPLINGATHNWWLVALPLTGIVLTGVYQRYIIRQPIYHGIGRLAWDFRNNRCYLPVMLTYSPVVSAMVTLGLGASAGAADPIAYSGAAIGSNVASTMKLPSKYVRALVAIGAGAGIAGMFKAPVAGALFSIEIIGISMSAISMSALILACTVSGVTAYLLPGLQCVIPITHQVSIDMNEVLWIGLLGVLCGLYSTYYVAIMNKMTKFYARFSYSWTRFIFAGLLVGCLVFLFPGLYCEGYHLIGRMLNGDVYSLAAGGVLTTADSLPTVIIAGGIGILVVKAFATSSTICGGGVAGEFAPSIMIGAVLGMIYVYGMNHIFGLNLGYPAYIVLGMAGVLSGAVRAPLTAIFLINEVATTHYGQFLPIAIVATLSYLVMNMLSLRSRTRRSPRRLHRAVSQHDPKS